MVHRLDRAQVAEKAIIHADAAPLRRTETDRSFELPTALYAITACGYLGFFGVMALGFGSPGLVLPMMIIVIFIAMFFGVPAQWVRMKPANPRRALGWDRFLREGIMTATGRLPARDAAIQVLILPLLILAWGMIVVTIAALA
jgi:hypothetical protein